VKRLFFLFVTSILVGFGGLLMARAQTPRMPDEKQTVQPKKRGGLITLYALDPLSRTLCFSDGKEGFVIDKNRWGNRCSDLSFNLAPNGSFVTGIEVNRIAAIVDLGTANDLRGRYGYEDADNGGVGFASLRLDGGKIMILKDDHVEETYQPLQEGPKLFTEVGPSANAPIKLGHIYLVRIADQKDKSFQQIAKLIVVAYRPDESVTLRWELL
jgi:hypothetical protein